MCNSTRPWQMPSSSLLDSAVIRTAKITNILSDCADIDNIHSININNSNHINTASITIVDPPINGTDGTNKDYVDSKLLFDWKNPVLVATTTDVSLSGLPGTIDGYPVTTGDRVLVHKQINGIENGIYLIKSGTWERAADLNTGQNASGVAMWVLEGTVYVHTTFVCDSIPGSDIVGTDPLIFVQFSGGSGAVVAGDALTLTGNTLDVNVNTTDVSVNVNNQLQLTNTSVLPGTYGSSTKLATFTVDSKGRLTSATNVSLAVPLISNIFKVLNYTNIYSLDYTLSAAELLGTYVVVNGNITGDLTLPSVPSIVSAIGLSNFVTNMSFTFTIVKNGNNHLDIVLDPSITNPLSMLLRVDQGDLTSITLVLENTSTGIILPSWTVHTF